MKQATIQDFQSLQSLADLADFLGFPPKTMSYILYKLNGGPNSQYKTFSIKKRSGGTRDIAAPNTGLKGIQRQLNNKLQDIYMTKRAVHGFVRGRTILTNAQQHSRKRYVFKIDLKDFFPSIHFGRVMGLFAANPYNFKREIAILIAKISCFNDVLPQGSPCSPVISNMICAYMDKQISELSKSCGCYYTRYADDMTFSTTRLFFPEDIASFTASGWEPSPALVNLINQNGFSINEDKTLMRTRTDRQLVTGLVVNDYPNIRQRILKQVRAMLHDWNVNGYDNAKARYLSGFDLANREAPKDTDVDFSSVVRGKLEHLRYIRSNRIDLLNKIDVQESIRTRKIYKKNELQTIHKDQYYKYFQRFEYLMMRDSGLPTILGEGESDWMHLRRAFSYFKSLGEYQNLQLNIYKHKQYALGGCNNLKNICNNANNIYVKFANPVICIFDCDIEEINKQHQNITNGYKYYGNSIYSILLPKPAHRNEKFAIEQLYLNSDIQKENAYGRRLFLSTEFDEKTGIHKADNSIIYGRRARDGKEIDGWRSRIKGEEKIIDSAVCVNRGGTLKNIALSKKDYASSILRKISPFDTVDFSSFKAVFDLIERIQIDHQRINH